MIAIKETLVRQGFSQPVKDYEEKLINAGMKVRYLYEPGELEGEQYGGERRRRSTDPIWLVDVYEVKDRKKILTNVGFPQGLLCRSGRYAHQNFF